jgi:hypothetical protein
MSAQQYDDKLAKKQWGWRKFGRKAGVSILLSRVRCNSFGPRFYFDKWTVTVRLMFGYGELWFRVPWRPA